MSGSRRQEGSPTWSGVFVAGGGNYFAKNDDDDDDDDDMDTEDCRGGAPVSRWGGEKSQRGWMPSWLGGC